MDRTKFYHPYEPYPIQLHFMQALYDCINEGKIGLFESPTGTGKSLSLACGSLTWLRDHKRKEFDDSLAIIEAADDEPEWIVQHAREDKKRSILQARNDLESRLEAIRLQEKRTRDRLKHGQPPTKKRKLDLDVDAADGANEDQFLLEEYESDDGAVGKATPKSGIDDLGLSKDTQALMQKLGLATASTKADEQLEPEDEVKIYLCSRTHSQLSQFVGELRRIKLPSAVPWLESDEHETKSETDVHEELKHLSLGSRKNLCINSRVQSLKNSTAINERCLELQDSKTPSDQKCPYVPKKENETATKDFQDYALAKIRDIEDLGELGKKLGVCPYYASRPAVKPSEIVTLPYPLLLQKSARDALGLSLKNNVVIIDEAHNLIDTILGIYTIEVSLAQLQRAREQLTIYLRKFRNKLKGKNRIYTTQVIRLLDSLILPLQSASESKKPSSGSIQPADLLHGKGVDQINLYKLMAYLQDSKLARKVEGYVQYESQSDGKELKSGDKIDVRIPVLTHIQSFLYVLTNPAREGRFFCTTDAKSASTSLKYMLLDPSEHFRDVVEEARAVILAGGTMSPMDELVQQMFPYLDDSRIMTLSCGHVIPPSNLFVCPVVKLPNGEDFDFTFSLRKQAAMINGLGESLVRILPSIPDGTVVFFPSYAYLDQVVQAWKQPATTAGLSSLWTRMNASKPIFQEARSNTTDPSTTTEDVLVAYSAAVASSRGALLLAVIGGKLSEGINFSDRLGRCVIVVGLPYPNPHAPEWKAKMEYLEQRATARGVPVGTASRDAADNVCMRAVNQAIGRAIRHKGDWSAILLVDRRYGHRRIQEKLPRWMQTSLVAANGQAEVEEKLRGFYAAKKHDMR